MFDSNHYDSDKNNENQNENQGAAGESSRPGEEANGTIWEDDGCYHGRPAAASTDYSDAQQNSAPQDSSTPPYTPYSSQPQQSVPYRPYGTYEAPESNDSRLTPKKPKKHTFRKVVAGVLCCLIISVGSIAGFTALVNNGTIKLNTPDSGNAAFTIQKNSASSTASATNMSTAGAELTKQEVAKKVLPSVVCIENYSSQKTTTRGNTNRYGFGDFGDDEGGTTDGTTGSDVSPTSEGSGIITTADGYIITNAHVVSGASSLKVILYNGKTYSAKLIGSDSLTDLALIKIDATGLTAAQFGSSDDLQIADAVMAIGNPGGMEFNSSVTVGYISALNREITNSETGYTMKCIQTDAAINPGNSGGALVNMKGQVIGINSSKIVATGYEGLGFSIPINTAQPVITELKKYGYVKDRAMLGITGTYIDSMTSRYYGLSTGMYISSISSQYVTSAGLQKGDVITKVDGKDVTSQNTVSSVIASKKPGESVTLTVSRSSTGKTFTASVKLIQATGKS